jgi:Uncharacterized conserved protein
MTFSIVLYDANDEAWGVGVASKFLAVGAFVPWLEPNVGAIATQALANLEYGPKGLKLLKKRSAQEVLTILTSKDPLRDHRQIGIVDSKGNAAAYTGKNCYPYASHIVGNNFSVQGNILAGYEVLESMAKEAEGRGRIYEKILNSLKAGELKGGDKRGKQSAAMIIVKKASKTEKEFDPTVVGKYIDIRIDDNIEPLKEMERILELWSATFIEEEMIDVSIYEKEIKEALKRMGYSDLKTWVEINNFEGKYTGSKIGKTVLKILLKQIDFEIK